MTADEPCSEVGITLGYTVSENYTSITMHASVTVPCKPGKEHQAQEYAFQTAQDFLTEKHDDVMESLEELSS